VLLIFGEHLLEVLLLLSSLLLLKSAFSIHFLLKAFHQGNFLAVLLLLILAAADFIIQKLLVAAHLLLHDAGLKSCCLLDFFLFKKPNMLLLKVLIHATLFNLCTSARVFLLKLLIELLFNKSLAFLITKDSLLLLFVMEKGVEFLDGGPLIFFFNL
jgi:hypothetical protein